LQKVADDVYKGSPDVEVGVVRGALLRGCRHDGLRRGLGFGARLHHRRARRGRRLGGQRRRRRSALMAMAVAVTRAAVTVTVTWVERYAHSADT